MNDLIQKTKDFFVKLQTKKVSYERPGIMPTNDWKIIISSTILSLVVIAGVSFYFYTQINNGQFFIVEDSSTEKDIKIDNTLLKKTVDEIRGRETSLANIKQNRNIPSDPSI